MTSQADPRPQAPVVSPAATEPDPLIRSVRHLDLDRAKGFAIALVVWGHLASVIAIQSTLWFLVSIAVVYSFHMPLFMYLSGFVYFLKNYQNRFWESPLKYTASRFDRLMVPFILFGVIVVLGKYTLNGVAPIPDPVNSIESGILSTITNAPGNPSASIWYLIVLFSYTIIVPLLWRIGNRSFILIFVVAIFGQIVQVTNAFYIDRIFTYLIFFAIGGYVAINNEKFIKFFKNQYILLSIVFFIICAVFFDHEWGLLICGLASLPAIHGIFLQDFWRKDRLLLLLGNNSMTIYLLNTIVLGVCGFALSYVNPGYEYSIFPSAIIIFVLGLCLPIFALSIIRNFSFLNVISKYLR